MTDLGLAHKNGRCSHGFAPQQRQFHLGCPDLAPIAPTSEWQLFKAAVTSSVREDGSVHQSDVRPLIRGRIEPKHIGQLYKRAVREGLLAAGDPERSDDELGKNAGRWEPSYRLVGTQAVAA